MSSKISTTRFISVIIENGSAFKSAIEFISKHTKDLSLVFYPTSFRSDSVSDNQQTINSLLIEADMTLEYKFMLNPDDVDENDPEYISEYGFTFKSDDFFKCLTVGVKDSFQILAAPGKKKMEISVFKNGERSSPSQSYVNVIPNSGTIFDEDPYKNKSPNIKIKAVIFSDYCRKIVSRKCETMKFVCYSNNTVKLIGIDINGKVITNCVFRSSIITKEPDETNFGSDDDSDDEIGALIEGTSRPRIESNDDSEDEDDSESEEDSAEKTPPKKRIVFNRNKDAPKKTFIIVRKPEPTELVSSALVKTTGALVVAKKNKNSIVSEVVIDTKTLRHLSKTKNISTKFDKVSFYYEPGTIKIVINVSVYGKLSLILKNAPNKNDLSS